MEYTEPCINASDLHIEYVLKTMKQSRFGESEASLISALYIGISTIGIISNGVVCLIVTFLREMRTSANIFIGNMSMANFLFSAILVPFLWLPYLKGSWDYGSFWCKQISVIAGVNVFCSTFTIIALAADRYYTVTFTGTSVPLKQLRSLFVVGCIWLAASIFSIPFWLYYTVSTVSLEEFCRPDVIISTTCDFLIPKNLSYVVSCLQLLFLLPIPMISLSMFNCKLSQFLAANVFEDLSSRNRRRSTVARKKVPFLLFAMTASYAVLSIPFLLFVAVGDMSAEVFIHYDPTGDMFRRIHVALHLLSSLSVCVNPILYGFFNSSFKRAFNDIWNWAKKFMRREASWPPPCSSHAHNEIGVNSDRKSKSIRFSALSMDQNRRDSFI